MAAGRIVRMGNSRGIRLPQPLLEQSGLDGVVDIEAVAGQIILRRPALAFVTPARDRNAPLPEPEGGLSLAEILPGLEQDRADR